MATTRNKEYKKQTDSVDELVVDNSLLVSVVIPFLPNRNDFKLQRLLKAVKSQTIKPDEIIVIDKPQSSYHNRNEGWKKAANEIIWFLDCDMIPDKDALEKAIDVFKDKNPAGVEGHIYGTLERGNALGFMSGHIFYKRSVLEEIGGFDESFAPFWRGDTDLAWSILDKGYDIIYCKESRAAHPDFPHCDIRIENEQRLQEKHPALYARAKKERSLDCKL